MSDYAARLAGLRQQLRLQGLDGFIVPIADEHGSEYVGAYARRLEWLTGFTGSAGSAVVLADAAAIFVDGRYTLQAAEQVRAEDYTFHNVPATSPVDWLLDHAPAGARFGFDPWLHSMAWQAQAQAALHARGMELVAVAGNPVDAIWPDRPAPSDAPAYGHPLALAGRSAEEKRAGIMAWLGRNGADSVVISALDSVAWLLNIRGQDVARLPVLRSFLLLHADGAGQWFVDPAKVLPEVAAHIGPDLAIRPYADVLAALRALSGKRVAVDRQTCAAAIAQALSSAEVLALDDPCLLPRAIKNPAEVAGHRAAQLRDGVAMVRFLHWLDQHAPKGSVTELGAARHLHALRQDGGHLRDLSFDTISGAGPNGAIVHYGVTEQTNRHLEPSSVYLVDSGGQYPDGTTDITRTVWISGPQPAPCAIKSQFTRVLKGHIALDQAVFPVGTTGGQLDVLARLPLWQAGLDYAHGTGHGVGSFLSVHEGPQRIAKPGLAPSGASQPLLAGMILSNEPGYYKAGHYGIRIENLMLVVRREMEHAEGEWLGFETLTLAPIDRNLLDLALLSDEERGWWNGYHRQVWQALHPLLDQECQNWLATACAPI